MKRLIITLFLLFFLPGQYFCFAQKEITISNLKPRLDAEGRFIDLHDGRVAKFEGKFYWYGTAYGNTSGVVRSNFSQCYSSSDLMNWTQEGSLLENAPSGVYYRPHVIYSKSTKKYVLWYNWYPRLWEGKFGVAISDQPEGPFTIINADVKVFYSYMGVGDFGLFVDEDDVAYIAYNTIQGHKGSVEKLTGDYLSSTLENGGFINENCEAGAIFRRNDKYYLLTDYTCCFCSQGSGARVYISDNPMKGYQLRNNINRFPGTLSTRLLDDFRSPNIYESISRQRDSLFSPIELTLGRESTFNSLKIYQFTGNRHGICGDTLATKVHDDIFTPEFEIFSRKDNGWNKISSHTAIETSSVYNIISITFDPFSSSTLLIKVLPEYPYNSVYLNEIEIYHDERRLETARDGSLAFVINMDPAQTPPIIPAQQTFVMPLKTSEGNQFIWMGDLWGSASDNNKGHDYQYWGAPLIFDEEGDIEPMEWVDEWKTVILD